MKKTVFKSGLWNADATNTLIFFINQNIRAFVAIIYVKEN